ncbi:hypothetical protein CH264_17720 [Rhodococcus sp. 06-1477-1A]|nr:hypothetical protein CH264_17720 [Rhodococcus sp. 06-1477-1A]
MRRQRDGYKSTPGIRSVSLATDATMARRVAARVAIRRLLVEEYGPTAVPPCPELDDLGTP